MHTQDHQMKMLSARPVTEINATQPMVYGNMQPKTDFMQSSKTQMLNLKESSHSKLSTTNSVTRQGAVLSSSDKQHLTTLKTTTKKQTQLEKIPIEQKKQMFHQRCDRQIFRQLPRCDRNTLDSVFHVSEFCGDILENMIAKESKWAVDYLYMDR